MFVKWGKVAKKMVEKRVCPSSPLFIFLLLSQDKQSNKPSAVFQVSFVVLVNFVEIDALFQLLPIQRITFHIRRRNGICNWIWKFALVVNFDSSNDRSIKYTCTNHRNVKKYFHSFLATFSNSQKTKTHSRKNENCWQNFDSSS